MKCKFCNKIEKDKFKFDLHKVSCFLDPKNIRKKDSFIKCEKIINNLSHDLEFKKFLVDSLEYIFMYGGDAAEYAEFENVTGINLNKMLING